MSYKISAFYFVYFACAGVFIVYFPPILRDIGYSPYQIGMIFASAPLARFLSPLLFLKYIKLDEKAFFSGLIGALLCTVALYIFIKNFYLVLVLVFLLGFFYSLVLPFIEVMALEAVGKEGSGTVRLFGSAGFIATALALGMLQDLDIDLFMASYIACIVGVVILGSILSKHISKPQVASGEFKVKHNYYIWLALIVGSIGLGIYYGFYSVYSLDLGLDSRQLSYIWSASVLAEILIFYVQSRFIKRFSLMNLMQFCLVTSSLRWILVFFYGDSFTAMISTHLLHAFSYALLHSSAIAYLNQHYVNKQLAQHFYSAMTGGLGILLGNYLGGLLYGDLVFLYATLFSILALILMILGTKYHRQQVKI